MLRVVAPPQPGHHKPSASGRTSVEQSHRTTALKRCNRGMATGSAAITAWTAALSSPSKKAAPASPSRWSRPCGLIATPAAAAACANSPSEACGLASQPNTSAWANAAPVSFDWRCTKPVARARVSAVVVNSVCRVWARCGTVVIRRLLSLIEVHSPSMIPKEPSHSILTLMRMGRSWGSPRPRPRVWRRAARPAATHVDGAPRG